MTKGMIRLTLVALSGVALGAGLVTYADDDDEPRYDPGNDPKMIEMMKYSAPGPEHGVLRRFEGDWEQHIKWRTGPNQPWMHSVSECDNEMVLGGRYLQQEVEGKDDGDFKFKAIGFLGYDNYKRKYVGTWLDNMTTMVASFEGSFDPSTQSFTFRGFTPDFATGKNKPYRDVLTLHHKEAMTEQMFEIDEQGHEFMSLEIQYKRD